MTVIRFENIRKKFGRATVIDRLDLIVNEGEFFTFVGPSGCGKSTILHLVAGLEAPTNGSILFDDKRVNDLSPGDRDIALVFQSYALYPHLTVYENLAFPLRIKKKSKETVDREVTRVAALLGITQSLQKKPKELSGGQRQRVALGRAIIRKPRVFLMDEPLSNLDARLRTEMRSELKQLHRELGITTIYVTHDQAEAMGLSDRVAVLDQGSIQQCDAPREVYRRPANTFVAGFMGVPAMNILPAVVRRTNPLELEWAGMTLLPTAELQTETKEVLAGIRPEDLLAERIQNKGGVKASVIVVDPAGAINWVELESGGRRLRAQSRPDEELRPGEDCFVTTARERISLFDKVTGRRL